MEPLAPQSDGGREKPDLKEREKGHKLGMTPQSSADTTPECRSGRTSGEDAADGQPASKAGIEDYQGVLKSSNEDQDDEKPLPDMHEESHIDLSDDDVIHVASRSKATTPSTSCEDNDEVIQVGIPPRVTIPSINGEGKGTLEDMNFEIQMSKKRQVLYRNRTKELQLQQKMHALEKKIRAAEMAAGEPGR